MPSRSPNHLYSVSLEQTRALRDIRYGQVAALLHHQRKHSVEHGLLAAVTSERVARRLHSKQDWLPRSSWMNRTVRYGSVYYLSSAAACKANFMPLALADRDRVAI